MFTFFFFNDTATTEIYTLSLHDALPIFRGGDHPDIDFVRLGRTDPLHLAGFKNTQQLGLLLQRDIGDFVQKKGPAIDRKSTRLNSSHTVISYAVFCLKKKTQNIVLTLTI